MDHPQAMSVHHQHQEMVARAMSAALDVGRQAKTLWPRRWA